MLRKLIAALCLMGLVTSFAVAQDKPKEPKKDKDEASVWMKQKLNYSQNLLIALAREDYESLSENGRLMRALNRVEYFVRNKNEAYRTQLKTFQYSINQLIENAEKKNLDGATLAFTQMTVSCVNCHKTLR